MSKENKNVYGIAGLTSYVKPDGNGKIDRESEVYQFLEGMSDKKKLKDILDDIPSGGGGELGPNSVGSEEIKDKSIEIEDLSDGVFATDEDIEFLFRND